jgi:hypothetical protein
VTLSRSSVMPEPYVCDESFVAPSVRECESLMVIPNRVSSCSCSISDRFDVFNQRHLLGRGSLAGDQKLVLVADCFPRHLVCSPTEVKVSTDRTEYVRSIHSIAKSGPPTRRIKSQHRADREHLTGPYAEPEARRFRTLHLSQRMRCAVAMLALACWDSHPLDLDIGIPAFPLH